MKTIRRYALIIVLWLVSAGLGAFAVIQIHEASRVVAALAMPIDPMQTVTSKRQIVLISRVVLLLLSMLWLAITTWLLVRYLKLMHADQSPWRLFVRVIVVELVGLGLATGILRLFPLLIVR